MIKINRITILLEINIIGACIILLLLPLNVSAQDNEKPNIIFILTDDQRVGAMGYAGNEIIRTPEMDKLARRGTYFETAIVTTPICAASRASILTGLYERTHGYTFDHGPLKEPYVELSYPLVLRNQGYHTGFFGKLGVNIKDADKMFNEAEFYDRENKYPNRKAYFYKTIDGDTVHLTRYTGHQAQQFIKNAPRDKPFSLSLNFSAPHAADSAPEQYFWQDKSNDLYTEKTIPPPALGGDKYFNALPKEVREGYSRERWFWRFDTPEKYQKMVKGYYRMITDIDDEIGELREVLEEEGIADNTVIVLMGDNGYFLSERQLADKWLMYDLSIRVPLIIFDPRVGRHYDEDDIVLNIDVPKTILSIAGVKAPKEYQGLDLMPYVRAGYHSKKRESALIEHLWELPEIPSSEGIRTEKWKYFRYRFIEAPEELYDLENDPLELNNLGQEDRYQDILKKLRKQLNDKIEKYEEERLVTYDPTHYDDNQGWDE